MNNIKLGEGLYEQLGARVGAVVDKKNLEYGDSINDTDGFLRVLFPCGIPIRAYKDVGLLVRIFDKMKRVAYGNLGEENAWKDLVGYALLGYECSRREVEKDG